MATEKPKRRKVTRKNTKVVAKKKNDPYAFSRGIKKTKSKKFLHLERLNLNQLRLIKSLDTTM